MMIASTIALCFLVYATGAQGQETQIDAPVYDSPADEHDKEEDAIERDLIVGLKNGLNKVTQGFNDFANWMSGGIKTVGDELDAYLSELDEGLMNEAEKDGNDVQESIETIGYIEDVEDN